jgi:TRAP-type C4-dicarboxylate transport system permease small subunit
MSSIKILAVLFILGGGLGLAYGGFSYTKETHDAKIGPLEFSVKDKESVNIPQCIAVAAIGGGVLMLLFDRRKA